MILGRDWLEKHVISEEHKNSLVFSLLATMPVRAAVAGGYPRDMSHGKVPKDLDIVVAGGNADSIKLFTEVIELMGGEEFSSATPLEYGDARLMTVYKVGKIDVIWYRPEFQDVLDIIHTFDFNFNQYIVLDSGCKFIGCDEGILKQTSNICDPDRHAYMKEKAASYGWEISKCSEKIKIL